jgi:hypothetical protein
LPAALIRIDPDPKSAQRIGSKIEIEVVIASLLGAGRAGA